MVSLVFRCLSQRGEGVATTECSAIAQNLFNAKKLVVLSNAVASGWCACFDLSAIGGNGKVGNGGIFGFATSVTHDAGVLMTCGEFNSFEGLCE
jgi:hypothetical protein